MVKKNDLLFLDEPYKINRKLAKIIFISPIIITAFIIFIFIIPSTRSFGFWLLDENNPIEILTFLVFFIGGIYGVVKAIKFSKVLGIGPTLFYLIFSFFLILIAMEEIAWGQWFFHFETPKDWQDINVQGETTLHNISAIQGQNDTLRFIFGMGGLTGILFRYYKVLPQINVHFVLFSWFLIIACYAALDIITDNIVIDSGVLHAIYAITEVIELLIAGSAFLYLLLNFRVLKMNPSNN
ncbi:hypothetical protein [Flavivirga aquatica]|nr:hypothetical protein [Flavivirga aquatica]